MRWLAAESLGLLAVPAMLLCGTGLTGGVTAPDVRIHAALTAFLWPGWCAAPWLMSALPGRITWRIAERYLLATAVSLAIHGLLVVPLAAWGLGFNAYYSAFALVSLVLIGGRICGLVCATTDGTTGARPAGDVPPSEPQAPNADRIHLQVAPACGEQYRSWVLLAAVILFVCAAYRWPHSNDITQFLPQQIDAQVTRTLTPSPIGMTAWEVAEPMPRWKANTWHVWFSLLADATQLPVEGVVRRWACIPIAAWAWLALLTCVRSYGGRQVPFWVAVLAVVGPVTVWFRDYNAYVYAFRFTNNLCLDKDFALFWLISVWLWLWLRAVRDGETRSGLLLVALAPLCWSLHPLTPVYLVLLAPFALLHAWSAPSAACASLISTEASGAAPTLLQAGVGVGTADPISGSPTGSPSRLVRSLWGLALIGMLFLGTLVRGDAQSGHQQIEQLVHRDAARAAVAGGPLHYWAGHYATVRDLAALSNTTVWQGDQLRLSPRILVGCSLLVAWLAALVLHGVVWCAVRSQAGDDWRPLLAGVLTAGILIMLSVTSSAVLARAPHLYRGIERLHWFCYVPALAGIAQVVLLSQRLLGVRWRQVAVNRVPVLATVLLTLHLLEQTWHVARGERTLLSQVRGVNSLFDSGGLADDSLLQREALFGKLAPAAVPPRPAYLRPGDRVLPLFIAPGPIRYWEMRQFIWWPELYGEAHLLALRGAAWLENWDRYYDAVEHRASSQLADWLNARRVTLIIDERPNAEIFVRQVAELWQRTATPQAPGVWRMDLPDP